MDWTGDPTGHLYTCTTGACRAIVWQLTDGAWMAIVTHEEQILDQRRFRPLPKAQAWCADQLTQLRKTGGCSE